MTTIPDPLAVLFYGSAHESSARGSLARATSFVRHLASRIVQADHAVLAVAGREPLTADGMPLIFDWIVLEEVAASLDRSAPPAGVNRCFIISSSSSEERRIPKARRPLYNRLKAAGSVTVCFLADELWTGEGIRKLLLSHATAVVAISGGKGVSGLASQRGTVPFLPLDIDIGGNLLDGKGAPPLYQDAIAHAERYFTGDPDMLRRTLPHIALAEDATDPTAAGEEAFKLILHEHRVLSKVKTRGKPPSNIPEVPMLHQSITPQALDLARIKPWITLSDKESLYLIDRLGGTEVLEIRRRLELYGICRIRFAGQTPDEEIIKALARNFGEVLEEQNDYKGAVKAISPATGIEATTGDSSGRLGPHVDGTQYVSQPALLIFQYVRAADYGSESTFWDLAHVFLELEPAKRETMLVALAHPTAGSFGKKDMQYEGPMAVATEQHTVMVRERFDRVVQVHETVKEVHDYLGKRLEKQGLIYLPVRGDIVIFDNGRVMHGREQIGGDAQRMHRRMWIQDLRADLRSEILLGVRPIEASILARLPKRWRIDVASAGKGDGISP